MTDAALAILLVIIFILIFCSALFSGLETALFSLKPYQLRRLEEHWAGLNRFIQLFRANPRRVLNLLLLGDSLVKVPLVILCLVLLWEGPFASRIPQWLPGIVLFAIFVLGFGFISELMGPFRAVSAFHHRSADVADFDAAARTSRSRTGASEHRHCRSFDAAAPPYPATFKR